MAERAALASCGRCGRRLKIDVRFCKRCGDYFEKIRALLNRYHLRSSEDPIGCRALARVIRARSIIEVTDRFGTTRATVERWIIKAHVPEQYVDDLVEWNHNLEAAERAAERRWKAQLKGWKEEA